MPTYKNPFNHLLNPGHTACPGCGQLIAARHVIDACGKNTIIANATGCLEVTTSKHPTSSWKVPWIHSLFENPSAVGTGILAALKQKGLDKKVKVLVQGGDGSTFDIGLGLISGMWERGDNILYVCYDTEVYSNTGYQASGATPHDAFTRTSWPGKNSLGNILYKKNMLEIALAHNVPYVATSTSGYIEDIKRKVKKTLEFEGSKFIHILTPCVPGWGIEDNMAIELGKLAQKTGFFPVLEFINGELVNAMKVPQNTPLVEEYLKHHARFKHLFKDPRGKEQLGVLQKICDENIKKYNLR
ncbi:MAG: thiamine pyrophosphate-dependent enzyme [Candidatus Parcubacteria bacterium]|nr:thiamine pyrophosphate-dependent enzyme [Candidatus Parcubacteria bacterium]